MFPGVDVYCADPVQHLKMADKGVHIKVASLLVRVLFIAYLEELTKEALKKEKKTLLWWGVMIA